MTEERWESKGASLANDFLHEMYKGQKHGFLTLWTPEDKQTRWFEMNDISEAVNEAIRLRENHNVYFGIGLRKEQLSAYQRGSNRDIYSLPGVWIEIDLKNGDHAAENLPDVNEAKMILDTFSLEPTIINHSGGGWHCYWLFDQPAIIREEKDRKSAERMIRRFQDVFIRLARTKGLHVDKTSDLARVLRVPGTFNRKSDPKPVRTLKVDRNLRYSLSEIKDAIMEIEVQISAQSNLNTVDDHDDKSLPDAENVERIVTECQFIKSYLETKETATYPEWMAALSIGAYCENYKELCHEWSQGHVGYSEHQTDRKIHEIRSKMKPRTCMSINDEFGTCNGCKHFNEINSPISLGMKREWQQERPKKKKNFMRTDLGNAERMVYRHGESLRYCNSFDSWFIWNGKHWYNDKVLRIQKYATETIRSMYKEANEGTDADVRKSLSEHAMRSESHGKITAMMSLARALVPIVPEQLDADPWLFNCENGIVDLKTGQLFPHDRSKLITKMAPVKYDPNAKCPTWERFLEDIMANEKGKPKRELIEFLQKAVGYSLTGDTSEQVLFFLYGTGRNGKSTFVNTILEALGDYGKQTNADTFTVKKTERVNSDIAALKGARLVSATESEEGARLAESLVKQLSGGEAIQARFLYQDLFEYIPQFKLFFTTNHKPIIKGGDLGIWRRIRLIPFSVTISEEKKDKRLPEKLEAEMPGILRWAVEGCLKWQQEGLGNPDEVKQATEGYKAEMDVLGTFLDECCVVNDLAKCWASDLFNIYKDWCTENGEYELGKRKFNKRLEERGFKKKRGTGGNYQFHGVGVKTKEQYHRTNKAGDYEYL